LRRLFGRSPLPLSHLLDVEAIWGIGDGTQLNA
jgi:hypothetical protein